jgi:hypothetical protein
MTPFIIDFYIGGQMFGSITKGPGAVVIFEIEPVIPRVKHASIQSTRWPFFTNDIFRFQNVSGYVRELT